MNLTLEQLTQILKDSTFIGSGEYQELAKLIIKKEDSITLTRDEITKINVKKERVETEYSKQISSLDDELIIVRSYCSHVWKTHGTMLDKSSICTICGSQI